MSARSLPTLAAPGDLTPTTPTAHTHGRQTAPCLRVRRGGHHEHARRGCCTRRPVVPPRVLTRACWGGDWRRPRGDTAVGGRTRVLHHTLRVLECAGLRRLRVIITLPAPWVSLRLCTGASGLQPLSAGRQPSAVKVGLVQVNQRQMGRYFRDLCLLRVRFARFIYFVYLLAYLFF